MSNTETPTVAQLFDRTAAGYDRARRQLVHCFDDFYGTALSLIPYAPGDAFRVLDLGAGTGLFSALIAAAYPNATFTLVDVAPEMLSRARERFAGREGFSFVVADFAHSLPEGEWDVVVSALAIHHLSDPEKADLFRRLHDCLPAGGVFINAEQVIGPTPEIDRRYREAWLRGAHEKGVSEADLAAALERMKADRPATLADQLRWLDEAGFDEAHCWFQHHMFAVYSGAKR